MKTTLFLSALAAGMLAVSTTTFAQNFGAYPQAYGNASVTPSVAPRYTAPTDRFTHSYDNRAPGRTPGARFARS